MEEQARSFPTCSNSNLFETHLESPSISNPKLDN